MIAMKSDKRAKMAARMNVLLFGRPVFSLGVFGT